MSLRRIFCGITCTKNKPKPSANSKVQCCDARSTGITYSHYFVFGIPVLVYLILHNVQRHTLLIKPLGTKPFLPPVRGAGTHRFGPVSMRGSANAARAAEASRARRIHGHTYFARFRPETAHFAAILLRCNTGVRELTVDSGDPDPPLRPVPHARSGQRPPLPPAPGRGAESFLLGVTRMAPAPATARNGATHLPSRPRDTKETLPK